jgi:FKBP-type peptidyl-prolyl cis-trans isomerase FklB
MKYGIIIVLDIMLFVGVCSAGYILDLKDEKVRLNYIVGYQVGGDLKRRGIEINREMLLKGVQDAVSGNEFLMTREEMSVTLVELQKKVTAAEKRKKQEEAEKNLAQGETFLAENGKKVGVVTLPSGFQYKVLREGSGKKPGAKDTVTVHYRGTLIDGTEFDSSYSRKEPAVFRADHVIAGWKETLQLMKTGSKWVIFIPPNLAYGESGTGRIEPNSTLIFEIELLSIE